MRDVPQGLKPAALICVIGPAKAVPLLQNLGIGRPLESCLIKVRFVERFLRRRESMAQG